MNQIYVTLILFALHYIQQNARSTVQTEQAMPEMFEGVGPGRAKRQQIWKFSDISVGQCMFRRCVFLFLEKYISENEKTPGRPHFDKEQERISCDAMYVT